MAGSGTKGGCTVNLINMKKREGKAPAEMSEKKNKKKLHNKKKEEKKNKRKKKRFILSATGLEVFLETNSWLHLFENSTTSCSILELAVFDELLG